MRSRISRTILQYNNTSQLALYPIIFNKSRNMATYSGPSVEFGKQYVTKGINRLLADNLIVKGEGSYVDLEDGRKMLDFTCGIGVTNLGKCCW